MNIVYGILGILIAYLLLRYRGKVYDFTGPWGFAERYLGAGGTSTAMVLLAIIIFLISVTTMTGKMGDVLGNTIGKIFH